MQPALTSQKVDLRRRVATLYRGPLFQNAADEHWIMGQVSYYRLHYIDAVNELLSTMASAKDYASVRKYAAEAIRIMPGNLKVYY